MNLENYLPRIRKNIPRNYLFLSLSHLDLTRGLWMIYLKLQGFSLIELGILEGTFHLTSFLMEVPTGIVADMLGRKLSRVFGRILFVISLLIMFLSGSFPMQILGFVLCALNYNLESGAGEALIYDSMKEMRTEDSFKRIAGHNNFIYSVGSIISFLIGGYFAVHYGYQWVFVPSIFLAIVSVFVALSFQEPNTAEDERKRLRDLHWLKALGEQTKESLKVVKNNPSIAFIILFTELIAMFIVSLFFYLQTYWKGLGWSEFSIGVVLAFSAAACAIGGLLANTLEKWLGMKGALIVFPFFLLICLWGVAATPRPDIFFALTGFVEGVLFVAVSDYLNKRIPSERRATILSFQSMAFSLYMILFFPLIGWIGEEAGLSVAFWGLAITGSVLYCIYVIVLFLREGRQRSYS